MTIDGRGDRAGADLRRELATWSSSDPERASFDAFERVRARRLRKRRLAAGVVAGAATLVLAFVTIRTFALETDRPAAPSRPVGVILYGDWDPQAGRANWYTVQADGSASHALGVNATCAVWWPDGSAILMTHDAAAGPGRPLRPVVIDPDGSDLRPLDAARNPDLNLGCGDVSPDGTTIALEGFGEPGHPHLDGIYSIDAANGGALTLLRAGPVAPPRYSPGGGHLSYFDTKEGVSPIGSGALFVMRADGTDPVRITPWGFAFDDHAWSPDGRWIVFQRPFGQLYLVRPDGTDLHRLPLTLPQGTGGLNPAWSPDGNWIAFSLQRSETATIAIVRPDGSGFRVVPARLGEVQQRPDWAPPPPR